jgi:hypothetical protein
MTFKFDSGFKPAVIEQNSLLGYVIVYGISYMNKTFQRAVSFFEKRKEYYFGKGGKKTFVFIQN